MNEWREVDGEGGAGKAPSLAVNAGSLLMSQESPLATGSSPVRFC